MALASFSKVKPEHQPLINDNSQPSSESEMSLTAEHLEAYSCMYKDLIDEYGIDLHRDEEPLPSDITSDRSFTPTGLLTPCRSEHGTPTLSYEQANSEEEVAGRLAILDTSPEGSAAQPSLNVFGTWESPNQTQTSHGFYTQQRSGPHLGAATPSRSVESRVISVDADGGLLLQDNGPDKISSRTTRSQASDCTTFYMLGLGGKKAISRNNCSKAGRPMPPKRKLGKSYFKWRHVSVGLMFLFLY